MQTEGRIGKRKDGETEKGEDGKRENVKRVTVIIKSIKHGAGRKEKKKERWKKGKCKVVNVK